jgi:tetratricopeptide (TPR) repeat protein
VSAIGGRAPTALLVGIVMSVTTALAQTAQTDPLTKPAPPQGKPPSFSAAGVQGSTAPSGYSTGITREETSAVNQGVNSLAPQLLAGYVPNWPRQSCHVEAELLGAVRANPQSYEANRSIGLLYLEHGDFSRSIPYLQTAHQLQPAESSSFHALVLALLGDKKIPEATSLLLSALSSSPQKAVLLRLLGLAYQTGGNKPQAIGNYNRAIAAAPDDAANLLASGLGLIAAGEPQAATDVFSKATAHYPKDAPLWLGLGLGQDMSGRKPDAVQSLLQAMGLDRDLAAAYFFLAALADTSAEAAPAIRTRLAEFAVAHPSNAEAHYDYALALWLQRRVKFADVPGSEIESQLKVALEADPAMARAHYLLGLFYADAGDLPRAEQELATTVRLEPGNADAHYRLAQDYQRTHDTELAATEMRAFLTLLGDGSAAALPAVSMTEPNLQSAGADLVTHMVMAGPCSP